jgi:ATP-binding cassette, subfamily B, bacterial MsbA
MRMFWSKNGRSGRNQLEIVWGAASGHRWAAPVLVVLGLAASVAETLGISLVILFLYAVIGGKVGPDISGGVLRHIFRFALSLSSGDRVVLAALILLFIAGKALFNLSYSLLTARVKNAVSERTRNAVFDTYLAVSYGYLRSKDQGALLTTLATESWAVADAFQAFTRLATNLCAITVFSVFLISIAYPVFFVAIAGVALLYGASHQLTKPARALGEEILMAMRELTLHMINTLQAMRTIRVFSAERRMQAIFRQSSARVRRAIVRTDWIYSITGPVNELGYFLLLGAIAWTAMRFNVSTASTLGAVALLYRLQPHLREFEANRIKLAGMGPTLSAVDSILRLRSEHWRSSQGSRFSGLSQTIVFEDVSFRYPGCTEPALCRLQFSVPKGSRTVICGASGAGKTTIINLLLGLYSPSEGRILADGVPLAEIEASDWLAGIALAGQDAELFEATVRDNIAIVRPDADEEEIAWAARNAGIHDTILRLPAGYNTWIGERGLNVSGGQRQRIALARAFLRKPSILILDEATNAVDVPLEAEIRRNVLEIMKEGTVIYITHRPDDVPGADHCIWLSDGRVQYEGEPLASLRISALRQAQPASA